VTGVTGQTTVYYSPYRGQIIPLYDGTRFNCVDTGGEISQLTTDTTKSPAAVAASSCYDVFVWSDAGTIRATRGPAWTNVTTRSAGTALTRQNGIYLNNASITNGPAALRGTYVGTICSNGSSTIDYSLSAAASTGSALSLGVWNQYNRVMTTARVVDTTSYTYAVATIREAHGATGNQISFVSGNGEDAISVQIVSDLQTSAVAGNRCDMGIGLDTTTGFQLQQLAIITPASASYRQFVGGAWTLPVQVGQHTVTRNENAPTTTTCTINQNATDFLLVTLPN